MQTPLTNIQKLEAVNCYVNSNMSLEKTGALYSVTGGAVLKWVKRFKVKSKRRGQWHGREETNKKIVEAYLAGMRTKDIAKKYEVTGRTVYDLVTKAGYKAKKLNETLGITPELKAKVVKMYEDGMNASEIAKELKVVSCNSVLEWVKYIKKSASEIAAIRCQKKGSFIYKGNRSIAVTRFGDIKCDSNYERKRILQLCENDDVVDVKRCPYNIQYFFADKIKLYNPDFIITYTNDRIVVEEIKPNYKIEENVNQEKIKSALLFFNRINIEFSVITENILFPTLKHLHKQR